MSEKVLEFVSVTVPVLEVKVHEFDHVPAVIAQEALLQPDALASNVPPGFITKLFVAVIGEANVVVPPVIVKS